MNNYLQAALKNLPSTSRQTIHKLESLKLKTYWDLLNYFPFRYEDYNESTYRGKITSAKQIFTRRGLRIQKFTVQTEKYIIELSWYNQPYLLTILKSGVEVAVAGKLEKIGNKLILQPREYEIIKYPNQETIHTGRLVPIYPEKRGLSSRTIREKIFNIFNSGPADEIEFLPEKIIFDNKLLDELSAYQNIHFPENSSLAKKAKKRLSFDEIFTIQLSSALVRKQWDKELVTPHQFKLDKFKDNIDGFINTLPFKLTKAQQKVIGEILSDLQKTKPMNRFLQGEVGSGKTVVAAVACYLTYLNGHKSLFMAPTEILANQHFQTIVNLMNSRPVNKIKVILITGSTKPSQHEIKQADIIIGTHALIQKKLEFGKVGFIVIDEQHRFGVAQRAQLKEKGLPAGRQGINPHLLTMTATPIPRTVALTLYGELDLSVIDEMPKGRIPVKTYLVPKHKRDNGYNWIKQKIDKENVQVFIICPLIEESDIETMKSVKAAKKEFEYLKNDIFKKRSVALLHGKLKGGEKNKIMNDFKDKKYHLLVSTSVVEVGVDIPNATIILIEGAERYGLAQLHQLRGRVGRGNKQSYCFLFTEKEETAVIERLKFFTLHSDGARLAEYDLKRRGPGEIYGTRQHGSGDLKIASLGDYELIESSKKAVEYFLQNYELSDFSTLQQRLKAYKTHLITRD